MYRIRTPRPEERDTLLAVWRLSVEASHAFLSGEVIAVYQPMVRELLAAPELDLFAVYEGAEDSGPLGFMALGAGSEPDATSARIEALFIDPKYFRKGLGSLFVKYAQSGHGTLTLDVNEGNPGARVFYRRMGFQETGRSEVDGAGKPFPLIHMRWEKG